MRIVYERIKERLGCDFDVFNKAMAFWEFIPVIVREELCGVVLCKGHEFHVVAIKAGRWASRKLFSGTLGEAIKNHGYAQTTVMKDHTPGNQLAVRLGFVPVKEDGNTIVYRLERIRHA